MIGQRIRELRKQRRWTQAELAKLLGISQNYLSELERGQGSFTAEQLITILKQFNVQIDYFSPPSRDIGGQLQNALARLGADHLLESGDLIPSEKLKRASDAIREALISADSARQVTAIAPVLVQHAGQINLAKLWSEFERIGLDNRLGWALENTWKAIKRESDQVLPRSWRVAYRRAELILANLPKPRRLVPAIFPNPKAPRGFDILDPDINSQATLDQVVKELPPSSKRWKIATRIEVDDFVQALRAARGSD